MDSPAEITRLLQASRLGDPDAGMQLAAAVYPELRKIAAAYLRRQAPGHTLQPTALLHEAYLKLSASDADFRDRAHFFAVSAAAMRQILVDYARAKATHKRAGAGNRVPLVDVPAEQGLDPEVLIDLHAALEKLAQSDPRKAQILELRYFGALTVDEIADATHTSVATVGRELRFASAWIRRELSPAG